MPEKEKEKLQKEIEEAEEILRFAQSEIARVPPGSPEWKEYRQILEYWGKRLDSLYRQLHL